MSGTAVFDEADLAHLSREDRERIRELLDFSEPAACERARGPPERRLEPDRETLRAHGYTLADLPEPWARLEGDDGREIDG